MRVTQHEVAGMTGFSVCFHKGKTLTYRMGIGLARVSALVANLREDGHANKMKNVSLCFSVSLWE